MKTTGRMAAAAAVLASVAVPGAALAERFYMMRVDASGMIVVDADTIDRQGDVVRMRDFAVPPAPVRSGSATLNYTSAMTSIDCSDNTFQATDYYGYLPDGSMTDPEAGTAGWAPIEAGSARAAMRRLGCENQLPTGDQSPLNGDMRAIADAYRQALARTAASGAPATGGQAPATGGK